MEQARDTLTRVREFVKKNPTIYLSTHTPQGYQNLEARKIMNLLDDVVPSEISLYKPIEEKTEKANEKSKKWICSICEYEHYGNKPPEKCPKCKKPREVFKERVSE